MKLMLLLITFILIIPYFVFAQDIQITYFKVFSPEEVNSKYDTEDFVVFGFKNSGITDERVALATDIILKDEEGKIIKKITCYSRYDHDGNADTPMVTFGGYGCENIFGYGDFAPNEEKWWKINIPKKFLEKYKEEITNGNISVQFGIWRNGCVGIPRDWYYGNVPDREGEGYAGAGIFYSYSITDFLDNVVYYYTGNSGWRNVCKEGQDKISISNEFNLNFFDEEIRKYYEESQEGGPTLFSPSDSQSPTKTIDFPEIVAIVPGDETQDNFTIRAEDEDGIEFTSAEIYIRTPDNTIWRSSYTYSGSGSDYQKYFDVDINIRESKPPPGIYILYFKLKDKLGKTTIASKEFKIERASDSPPQILLGETILTELPIPDEIDISENPLLSIYVKVKDDWDFSEIELDIKDIKGDRRYFLKESSFYDISENSPVRVYTAHIDFRNLEIRGQYKDGILEEDIVIELSANDIKHTTTISKKVRLKKPLSIEFCEPIFYNGDPNDKVDVAFIGDGYSRYEIKEGRFIGFEDFEGFADEAKKHIDKILSYEPFSSNKQKINAYIVEKDLGFVTKSLEIERIDFDKIYILIKAAHSSCPADVVIVLSMEDFRSFAFGKNAFISLPATTLIGEECGIILDCSSEISTVHEFGHAFGGLADEYAEIGKSSYPHEPNCAPDETTAKAWWGNLVEPNWEENPDKVGYYSGCSYMPENIKPTFNSIMNYHWEAKSFGTVNEKHLKRLLDDYK